MTATSTAPPVLSEIARRVVSDCLCTAPGESLLLVTDTTVDPEVRDALVAAAEGAGAELTHVTIAARATSGAEPPAPVAAAMAAADVCLCVASRSIYHTNAKGLAQAAGTRGLFNAPPSLRAWTEGAMTADYVAIRTVAERVADRLRAGRLVRVTSPAGSDITVSREGREPKGWYTAIVREAGEASALPGGEVSFPPLEGTSNGTIVFERVVTDLGGIAEPITITVQDGHAVAIEGGADADRLRTLIDGVEGATNIGELGIGLNPVANVSDDITETKKRAGTAHFALGDNAGGYGGVVECALHLDGMLFDVSVYVDGDPVVRDGEILA